MPIFDDMGSKSELARVGGGLGVILTRCTYLSMWARLQGEG